MLYTFALTRGLGKILSRLKSPDRCHIVNGKHIGNFLDLLVQDQPSQILGLGSYSGIDKDKIRIERITTNHFRNDKIEENAPNKLSINNFLSPSMPSDSFRYADAIGNSWCNLISWKIMRLVGNGALRTRYSFLHIPKNFNLNIALQAIDQALLEQ